MRMNRSRGPERIRSPQAMLGTDSGCDISDFQIGRDPLEIRIRGKQAVELINLYLTRIPVS